MDEALLAAYLATDYRIRLPAGGCASLRIGAPMPDALRQLTGDAAWGVITAWNPRSQPMPKAWNRRAQRALLADLRQREDIAGIHAAVGVGVDGWREPSLLVIGPDAASLRSLCARLHQHAFVAGEGGTPPRLCWTGDIP
ncbi:DUF3293 domain-containing protein [Dyella sp. KRB-257]|uniref:DUF3293 domain-containing protein n=1 Tax=Dyella sp. KRB-257 TaxID=3400915 RepID=UPI003C04B3EB